MVLDYQEVFKHLSESEIKTINIFYSEKGNDLLIFKKSPNRGVKLLLFRTKQFNVYNLVQLCDGDTQIQLPASWANKIIDMEIRSEIDVETEYLRDYNQLKSESDLKKYF